MAEYIGKRYEILKLIGKGGMADVYLAYDPILKREVAIKILKSDMSDDPNALERFKREAGAITQLSHPNIVDVYDVGDDGDKHYIVMEYIKGYTLKQLIRKRGPIPYKEAVWMMKQLAGALLEAHKNGVIHRDVKSQNVIIKDDGTVKLSDFGIALANDAIQLTSKDSVLGSVHYLAPELSKGKSATMQSDIYSLGIVFFELLTGDVPFKADTPVQVALKHVRESIPSIRKINNQIPQSVENIIIKATAKNLNNRYKNVALMLKDLNNCLKKDHLNEPKLVLQSDRKVNTEDKEIVKLQKKSKKSLFDSIFLVAATLLSILVLVLVLYFTGIFTPKAKLVKVPNLTNLTVQEAKDILANNNLEVDDSRITWTLSDDIQKDYIISSNPAADEEVEQGTRIKLIVSSGQYSVLGNYVGKNYNTAKEELNALNFIVRLVPVESDKTPGEVIEQSLDVGYKYDPNQNNEITIKYSQENIIILDYAIKGMDIDEATDYFDELNIPYVLTEEDLDFFSEDELKDSAPHTLIKTNPELGMPYLLSSKVEVIIYYYEGASEQ